jgi:hypothetical protein
LTRDHSASVNAWAGSGINVPASTSSNTCAGMRPSKERCLRTPATSRHQCSAEACISATLANSLPFHHESRI